MTTAIPQSDYRTDPLWRALASMRIEQEGARLTFPAKLAREQGWSLARAEAVFEEYRRFLYLASKAEAPVSPSETIDRCWHLHLTYSRHYWEVLCGVILQRPLHHDPSAGGRAEEERHAAQHRRTIGAYRTVFGEEPPTAIWGMSETAAPSSATRRAAIVSAALGSSLLLAACTALAAAAPAEDAGGEWLVFVLTLALLSTIVAIAYLFHLSVAKRERRSDAGCGGGGGSHGSDASSDGCDGGSSCGGGCGGGGD